MRRLFIVSVVSLVAASTATAQSRWTISAGPEWAQAGLRSTFWGMRLRAEYDITRPTSVFGLRLEGGGRWGPTQSYFYEFGPRSEGRTDQTMDLMLGLSGRLSPLPRARFSPYATVGIFGRQTWSRGSYFVQDSTLLSWNIPNVSRTRGDIIGTMGLGLLARIAGRSFQLELRRIYNQNSLTFGTRLPF